MTTRRNFLRQTGGVLAGFLVGGCLEPAQSAAAGKPNILFIFSDDQCHQALRAAGNLEIETPNLDRFAKQSVHFTHAYNQGSWSGAVCVASRAMLNTGRFLWDARNAGTDKNHPAYKDKLWPEMMRDAGYRTYFSGKWHVRNNPENIFDVAGNIRGGMPEQHKEGYNRPVEGKEDKWKPWKKQYGGYWQGGRHWSEVLGDDGVKYLNDASKQDEPFFMYLAFNAPHDPRQSPEEFIDKYPLENISMPKNFLPEYPYNEAMGSGRKLRDEMLAPFPRTEYSIKVNRQEYYAIVTHMDQQVGRILDELERLGLDKNTYIMFTSDHGLAVGRHGLVGKQNMFDHSMRVPLMVSGPGIPKGVKTDKLVYLQDVMPTSLELAGADIPEYVQFNSLMPIIRSKFTSSGYSHIFGSYKNLQKMVTDGKYKLIVYPDIKKVLLFDLVSDPDEMNNLYGNAEYDKVAGKLFGELLKLQKQSQDHFDLKSVYPELI